jgi:hypothetical protein
MGKWRSVKFVRSGPRAVGSFLHQAIEPAARARGFATSLILSEWPAIAGSDLADFTAPDRLVWPRREKDGEEPLREASRKPGGATLYLRVDGPRAIEVQYRASQILERINVYFGYAAVTSLRIVQAPVLRAPRKTEESPRPVDESVLPEAAAGIESGDLRQALARLGANVKTAAENGE